MRVEDLDHWLTIFSRLHELPSLTSLILNCGGDALKPVSLPLYHLPSLVEIWLGQTSFLFPYFVSPNINTIRTLTLLNGSADFSNLCSGLCRTTTLNVLVLEYIELKTSGVKELAAALQQNRSLKKVKVKDWDLDDEDIRILTAVLEKHTL